MTPPDTSKEQGIDYEALAQYLVTKINAQFESSPDSWINAAEIPSIVSFLERRVAPAIRSDILRRAKEKAETYHWQDGITGDYEKNQIEAISIEDLTALCTEDLTKEEKI